MFGPAGKTEKINQLTRRDIMNAINATVTNITFSHISDTFIVSLRNKNTGGFKKIRVSYPEIKNYKLGETVIQVSS